MTYQRINRTLSYVRYVWQILQWPSQRRHVFRWIKSLSKDYLINSPSPWMTFDAIEYLQKYLEVKPATNLFEYGSGGSTLFWIQMGANVVSIEHDPSWYALIKQYVVSPNNIEYRLVEAEYRGEDWANRVNPANPDDYATSDEKFCNYSFENYVKQIDCFPDNFFNMVIIDGRSRPSCIKHSVNKVASGGILILDNSDRSYYLEGTKKILSDFSPSSYPGVCPTIVFPSTTTIYHKTTI